jgi:hypothetical protein
MKISNLDEIFQMRKMKKLSNEESDDKIFQ